MVGKGGQVVWPGAGIVEVDNIVRIVDGIGDDSVMDGGSDVVGIDVNEDTVDVKLLSLGIVEFMSSDMVVVNGGGESVWFGVLVVIFVVVLVVDVVVVDLVGTSSVVVSSGGSKGGRV